MRLLPCRPISSKLHALGRSIQPHLQLIALNQGSDWADARACGEDEAGWELLCGRPLWAEPLAHHCSHLNACPCSTKGHSVHQRARGMGKQLPACTSQHSCRLHAGTTALALLHGWPGLSLQDGRSPASASCALQQQLMQWVNQYNSTSRNQMNSTQKTGLVSSAATCSSACDACRIPTEPASTHLAQS